MRLLHLCWVIFTGSCSNLRFASLGSGSRGNATLIEQGQTLLMVDNGFSVRQTRSRLDRLGRSPEQITAILVTHEHADHSTGVEAFARKYDIPVWASHGTAMALKWVSDSDRVQCFDSHQSFMIESITVRPVAVPHDAREPTQFVFQHEAQKLGVLTDVGSITPHIRQAFSGCDALLLECNYDPQMLNSGPYPPALKNRVAGDWGHLSNQQAAGFLSELDQSRLQRMVLAHLSEKNNQPDLALHAIQSQLANPQMAIHVADQELGFDWQEINVNQTSAYESVSCCN